MLQDKASKYPVPRDMPGPVAEPFHRSFEIQGERLTGTSFHRIIRPTYTGILDISNS